VPGTHEIRFTSSIDQIALKHTAFNRTGFALGAVIAAEWIPRRVGFFDMADVLNLK
jgi:4-hydroxy-tetrahydrodipicolinate reductase